MARGGPYNLGRNGVGGAVFSELAFDNITMFFTSPKPIGNPGPNNTARSVGNILIQRSNNVLNCRIDLSGVNRDVRDEDTFEFRLTQQDRVVTLATSTDISGGSSRPNDPYNLTSDGLDPWARDFVIDQDVFLEWDTEGFPDEITLASQTIPLPESWWHEGMTNGKTVRYWSSRIPNPVANNVAFDDAFKPSGTDRFFRGFEVLDDNTIGIFVDRTLAPPMSSPVDSDLASAFETGGFIDVIVDDYGFRFAMGGDVTEPYQFIPTNASDAKELFDRMHRRVAGSIVFHTTNPERLIHPNSLVLTKTEWPKIVLGDGTASGQIINKMVIGGATPITVRE